MNMTRIVVAVLLGSGLLLHAPEVAAAQDRILIEYQGAELREEQDLGYVEFPIKVGPAEGRDEIETLEVEGQTHRYFYLAPEQASPLQVFRNYEQALSAQGFEILFSGRGEALGRRFARGAPHDQRIGSQSIYPQPEEGHYVAARGTTEDGRAVYVAMFSHRISMRGRDLEGRIAIHLDVVETDDMATGLVDLDMVSADEMLSSIAADGRIALYAIRFETDSDAITPESVDAVAEIARLLREHANFRLLVVGHTDSTGAFDHNLDLSFRRARSVVDSLVTDHDIAADRLRAAGAGMMSPMASNRSEVGRAANRRVELVEL